MSPSQIQNVHPDALAYAYAADKLAYQGATKEALDIIAPEAKNSTPQDTVSVGKEHPEAAQYWANAKALQAMARGN